LIAHENSRLSRHLIESKATVDKARFQIERIKAVLRAAEAKRKILATEMDASTKGPKPPQNWVMPKEYHSRAIEQLCSEPIEDCTQILLAGTITF
jgi:hypothetical protein